jgi:hypothetical protein
VFARVRYDVDAAVSASLAGAVPDALVVNIRDRSTKPLVLARRAAHHHGIDLGVDPMLMRMMFSQWANTASLADLPYAPSGLAPHAPRDLANRAAANELARSVIEAQADVGATLAFAAHFPVISKDDEWQRRNPSLLAASLDAAKAFDLPLWGVAAVSPEVICSPNDQTEFVNRLVRGEPAGWLLCVDGLSARAGDTTVLWSVRLALLLMERGAPVVVARATGLRRLLFAFGLGTEIGLGRYEGFRLSDMREGGGPGQTPPYFEFPELLCSLPSETALEILRADVLPRCECPSCSAASGPEEQVAMAPAHNASIAMTERDALARIPPTVRVSDLREQITAALVTDNRLRRARLLSRPLRHLRAWPRVLDHAVEMGLLTDDRLPRRLSA